MPTTDAQGRTISDDGNYWWDGTSWQLIKKSFLDTFADSVEGAVRKVEGSQGVTPPPAIPAADLLAYLGALRGAGVVTDAEFEDIRKRIPGQT